MHSGGTLNLHHKAVGLPRFAVKRAVIEFWSVSFSRMILGRPEQPMLKEANYGFNGVIHEFSPNQKITRTFEMEDTPFGVQLEFLEFEKLTDDTSKL
jgi:hypothetical protein